MKQTIKKTLAVALAACLAGVVASPALARGHHGGGHHGGGFHHGGHHHHHHGHRWHGSYGFYMDLTPAFWYPWYYHPYPYYGGYYGGSTVIVQQPVQYVSREDSGNGGNYWYYCHNPQGYYPYISQCNARWVKVRPFPADAPK